MVPDNLQVNKVSVSCLQVRNGIYQAVLEYYDENGKRQQPWRSTGLKERGNKKQAMAKAEELRAKLEKELQLKSLDNSNSNNNSDDILFMEYLFYWLDVIQHSIDESTFTSYRQITNYHIKRYFKEHLILITAFYGLRRSEVLGLQWDSLDFENKTITIKHTVIITNTDGKRRIKGKDKTKNKSSYRTLPLLDNIRDKLLEIREKQESFKKAFGNTYNKNYLNYVFVNAQGRIIRPDYVTQHFSILLIIKKISWCR